MVIFYYVTLADFVNYGTHVKVWYLFIILVVLIILIMLILLINCANYVN